MKQWFVICILTFPLIGTTQKYCSDLSLGFGARHNNMHSYENFYETETDNHYYKGVIYTHDKSWKPYINACLNIFKFPISKDSSIHFSVRSGLLYHQISRTFNFSYFILDENYLINHQNPIKYRVRTHNLGLSLGFIFSKTWDQNIVFEWGLNYIADVSFVKDYLYYHGPSNINHENIPYPKQHQYRNTINHEIYVTQNLLFTIGKHFSIGITSEIPTLLVSTLIAYKERYPIINSTNNYWNRNFYFGVLMRYQFNHDQK